MPPRPTPARPGAAQLELDLRPGPSGLPGHLRPMRPRAAGGPFDSAGHRFTPLWNGRRVLVLVEANRARVVDARGSDLTSLVSWAAGLTECVPDLPVVLDALLVRAPPRSAGSAPADDGGPSPGGRRAVLLVLDLLVRGGIPVVAEPLDRRIERLERLVRPSDRLVLLPAIATDGRAVHEVVVARGLAGTLARDRRSPYLAGRRSGLWRRIAARGPVPGPPDAIGQAAVAGPPEAGARSAAPILRLIEQLRLALG